jgi:hypothetical protein
MSWPKLWFILNPKANSVKKIIFASGFHGGKITHGGTKRTAQLIELFQNNGFDVTFVEFPSYDRKLKLKRAYWLSLFNIKAACALISKLKLSFFKITTSPFFFIFLMYQYRFFVEFIRDQKKDNEVVLVWEYTLSLYYVIPIASKHMEVPCIAVPQNLESLVKGSVSAVSRKQSPDWFLEEIDILKTCDAVFVMSKEEVWLLKIFGMATFYLPYFPSKELAKTFEEVALLRMSKGKEIEVKNFVVLIGSASNILTRIGMEEVIAWFESFHQYDIPTLYIMGFGTDVLKKTIKDKEKIKLIGEVDDGTLTNFLSEAKAIIVHQKSSSGALTRLPDFFNAGIPVLASPESIRGGYENQQGLHVFETPQELLTFLLSKHLIAPEGYIQQGYYSKYFVDFLNAKTV